MSTTEPEQYRSCREEGHDFEGIQDEGRRSPNTEIGRRLDPMSPVFVSFAQRASLRKDETRVKDILVIEVKQKFIEYTGVEQNPPVLVDIFEDRRRGPEGSQDILLNDVSVAPTAITTILKVLVLPAPKLPIFMHRGTRSGTPGVVIDEKAVDWTSYSRPISEEGRHQVRRRRY